MLLRHILAATDESEAGRQAVRAAASLAAAALARLTVLRVIAGQLAHGRIILAPWQEPDGEVESTDGALAHFRSWLDAGALVSGPAHSCSVELGIAYGLPGIEICRFAERSQADLLVLGRKRHSSMIRLLLGDTADAVARRSRFPCLFVPPGQPEPRKILVALDGSSRGLSVLNQACDFARYAGATVTTVTVERAPAGESLQPVPFLPVERSIQLQSSVREVLAREGFPEAPLTITRGDVVERIVGELEETGADVLAIGYHRGGPPGIIEAGSNARRLAHVVPGAVLTVPL